MKAAKFLAAVAAIVAGLQSAPASAEKYRLGLITPPPHQWSKSAESLARRIKEATEGRVDISVFPSGQLGSEAQMLQQLQTGAIDFAFLTLGEFANRDPNYGIFLAPYIVKDVAGAQKLLKGKVAEKLVAGLDKFALKGFGWGMAGMREIVMRGKIASSADFSGKKMRTVPFAQELFFWQQLGAAPTPMPLPALYDAFANGQVDGMQIDFEGTWNSKYYEHAGTILASNHMMFPMLAVGSARKWQGISEPDRAVVEKLMAEELDGIVGAYASIDTDYLEKLRTTDAPVVSVDRSFFGTAVDNWYAEWRKKTPLLTELEAEAGAL
jgi:tripartite ATP-independent transporter DctP family solute receptor